ncbi:DNA polymerase III subunit gamma/tau [Vampirovibrio chlorellavorus]|uniref:DNA polymerase III subunit gamma/tau n=1 Tax=Vampirovibrio chlorellavorus TaxID=758823 RepID=UPI0026EA5F07|nr:DNA polymerase III subunit gamma/tau [Vampirovibrio chlorellavorus]
MSTDQLDSRPQPRIETYIPLYRKYRPQLFADLVGQEAISQTLGNAINLNKVAHAYLFCGPRGTGKTSTARIFAKSLNCEQGPTVSPCLQCASCTGIAQGNALDVIEFDAASNNGVGDARELIENCQYSSMTGRFKVYIIDEVHMLTTPAFNALLKTLEEPPANVIFIFATTEAHKVLPTIISRCQRFDFNRITTENIVSRLRYIAQQEAIAIDEEALLMIGRHARGGLRDAVGLLDQVSVLSRAQTDKVIGRKDVALFIGNLEEDLLLRLGGAIAERRAADLLHELNELLNRGIEPIQLLKDLTVHFRNLLLVQASGGNTDPELLSLPPDYFNQLSQQAALFPAVEEIPQIIGRLSSVERNVRQSSQPQLWLEVGLIELAYRYEIQLVHDLAERVSRLESQLAGGLPASAPGPAAGHAPVTSALPPKPTGNPSPAKEPAPVAMASAPVAPVLTPSAPAMSEPIPVTAAPAASAAPVASVTTVPAPVSGSLEALYAQACATIPSLMFRSLIQQQTFPLSQDGDMLVVGCLSEAHLNTVKKPEKIAHLQRAVDKAFGRAMRLELVLKKKKPAGASVTVSEPLSPEVSVPVASGAPEPVAALAPPVSSQASSSTPAPVSASATVVSSVAMAEPAGMTEPNAPTGTAVAEKPVIPFAPAMPKVEETPLIPLNFNAPPQPLPASTSVNAGPPADEDMPPMDMGDPPPFLDEDGPDLAPVSPRASATETLNLAGDPDLSEAKKHAVELLQGRILE